MKKKYIILLIFVFPLALIAQNSCSSNYGSALSDFKAGRYAEAQKKFIAVANVCGDYSEVYKMLRDCNAMMVQAQNKLQEENNILRTEIDGLKSKNKQLEKQKTTAEKEKSASVEKLSEATQAHAQDIIKFRRDSAELQREKQQLEADTIALKALVLRLQDSLRQEREKVQRFENSQKKSKAIENKEVESRSCMEKCDSSIAHLTAQEFTSQIDDVIRCLKALENSEKELARLGEKSDNKCEKQLENFYNRLNEIQKTTVSDSAVGYYIHDLLENKTNSPKNIQTYKEYQKSMTRDSLK